MIYTNFVDLCSLMLHAKFQNHRLSGSEEDDFKKFLLFIAMVAMPFLIKSCLNIMNISCI